MQIRALTDEHTIGRNHRGSEESAGIPGKGTESTSKKLRSGVETGIIDSFSFKALDTKVGSITIDPDIPQKSESDP